ncbi:MAG: UDP-glucose 4-epimerase GalE [Pirellulaceae bacterium]
MNVLVTGGAGYVGSHAVAILRAAGHDAWVIDNLSRGHKSAVPADRFVEGDLADRPLLKRLLREHRIDAVMHFAAHSQVGESMVNPAIYYENNITNSISLLEAMRDCRVWRIVFSSSAAVYGQPETMPIVEDTLKQPINPYGFSKLAVEQALDDYARAYGFGFAALRYFNAAGAAADGALGEDHAVESHLIPLILEVALGQRESIKIFGNDYPTPDGTCVRDYIHVDDLGRAHLAALERLERGKGMKMNLGVGHGFSVREVVEACRRETGHPIPTQSAPRREGDPPVLVADPSRARELLSWRPQFADIGAIVATAWRWHREHPDGYESTKLAAE